MLRYSRWSPPEAVDEVEAHVRAHLSSVAHPDDNPADFAELVEITRQEQDGGVLIIGQLDADPIAPYLLQGFHPEDDVLANPLTVDPIEQGRS